MSPGLDALKHIVVLMMENRSFDHMLGSLKAVNPQIDGVDGTQSNPDTQGNQVFVQPLAATTISRPWTNRFSPATRAPPAWPPCRDLSRIIFSRQQDVAHSQKIMYYFSADKLPVLTSLATNFAVFNRWFASFRGRPSAIAPLRTMVLHSDR
jgi:phospholipase C